MVRIDITRSPRALTFEVDAVNERGEKLAMPIAGEHALTLYLDKREIVTLMTLGQAPAALALGYLRNQRLVRRIEDIDAVQVDWEAGAVAVTTHRRGMDAKTRQRLAKRTVTTGCGQGTVFGDLMEEVAGIQLRDDVALSEEALFAVLEAVRRRDSTYKTAGAVHGCALASNEARSRILYFVEDVGRHNAVDAIAGEMWLDGVDGSDKLFYTTGRLTSEMVIKAAQMRIPFLVSRSGLTQMGHEVARRTGITLIGRAVGTRYLIFTGGRRFVKAAAPPALA